LQYAYDDLYRLTSETIAGATQNGTINYTFDLVGNRLQRNSTVPSIPATGLLNYDANDRTATDPYDPDGNLLSAGAGANTYDFDNRLVQAGGVSLVYDGDGNRVSETVAGTTTNYLVADSNLTGYAQVLDEVQSGAVSRTYTYGLILISQRIANSQGSNFYGFDGHGSVRFLTSSTGAVTDTYDYDAFGNLVSQTGTTANNYLFAGQQFDPALNIYYNRARYYDQRQGRFWTMDTVEADTTSPSALHRYLYANANPVNNIDPSGHDDIQEVAEAEEIDEGLEATAVEKEEPVLEKIAEETPKLAGDAANSQVGNLIRAAFAAGAGVGLGLLLKTLQREESNTLYFVHGTSLAYAEVIQWTGVREDDILNAGRGSLTPGAFFTFMLLPDQKAAIELASAFAQRRTPPLVLMIGSLPTPVLRSLLASGGAFERDINAEIPETVFLPQSFSTLNLYNLGRWGIIPIR
jgi:RHS repeat-associated protein